MKTVARRATRNDLGDGRALGRLEWSVEVRCGNPRLRAVQYSSASITVTTRVVTKGSAGSGDISSMSGS
jgi:hypothetical protein